MTTFRQVIPNSTQNPDNERFEFYLVWLSTGGGVRNWLFSHTDGGESDKFDAFTIEGLDNIRGVPSMERKMVNAVTKSMNKESFDYVKSIMSSNRVYRVDKTGAKIPIALRPGSVPQPNQLKEFQLKIRFSFQEADILNV